jgi:two-component system C4-dicarboxylate transport response regulator DctD
VPFICLAVGASRVASDAQRLGAFDIIGRPLSRDKWPTRLRTAASSSHPRGQHLAPEIPRDDGDAIFGVSPRCRTRCVVQRVAPIRCAMLIVGERGAGREMVARAIHAGPRNVRS